MYLVCGISYGNDLYHFGIKGQRWGIRRYQNADGTLTEAGKKRYGTAENYENYRAYKAAKRSTAGSAFRTALAVSGAMSSGDSPSWRALGGGVAAVNGLLTAAGVAATKQARKDYEKSYKKAFGRDLKADEAKHRKAVLKKAAIVGGTIAGTALAAYGAKKMSDLVNKGNAEWLKTGRDNVYFTVDAIGNDKVGASFFEKAGNAIKYYSGKTKRGQTMYALNP